MRRVRLQSALSLVLISSCFMSGSALAYYQDRFNPNSPSYDSRNKSYSGSNNSFRMRSFTNYAAYEHAVRTAMSRSYAFPDIRPASGRNVFVFDPKQLSWA